MYLCSFPIHPLIPQLSESTLSSRAQRFPSQKAIPKMIPIFTKDPTYCRFLSSLVSWENPAGLWEVVYKPSVILTAKLSP